MIFVDTSAWSAFCVSADPNHLASVQWMSGNEEPLLTTDYVIDETLTLLRARNPSQYAFEFGKEAFAESAFVIHYLRRSEVLEAWNVFRKFSDKGWSFTDCTSKVVMESLGIQTAFSFDQHFRQFGSVVVAP